MVQKEQADKKLAVKRRAGRSKAGGELTKDRILDAAEALFAEGGYDGVSLRQITQQAGVDLALANYHFETKENLFREVLRRRVDVLNGDRLRHLDEARIAAKGQSPTIAALIDVMVAPIIKRVRSDPGWRNYCRLIAHSDINPKHVQLISELIDPTFSHVISAMRMALPGIDDADLYWGIYYLLGAFLVTFSESGRIDLYSRGHCTSADLEAGYRRMVPFMAAGFESMLRERAAAPKAALDKGSDRPKPAQRKLLHG
ncbi:TetR/AcrR family transcriptional regulator [Govanella unica]|uniref:TetR family transcriptional regulator n=1 Tax=Govanella unica TaxID=2975056 RepID=A0A9X3TY01_9PROT|nr:TetR/AcrR family transcriptional regulator [Govania unica]MDA5194045.1 TetR family transcriptional regulator [Govania unica]